MIKFIIVVICAYALYSQWQDRSINTDIIWATIKTLPFYTLPLMIAISMLSWMVESKKWQYLINDLYLLRFRESVTQNLTAQAASFITPFRTGEFAVKSLYYNKFLRKNILSRILAGNTSQMVITTILGVIGLLFYLKKNLEIESVFLLLFTVTLLCLLAVTLTLWVLKKWDSGSMSKATWFSTLFYSLLRYLVFSSNWLLILLLLDNDSSILIMIRNITIFYLAVSIIPVFQLFDIAIKWTVATYIFTETFHNSEIIIITTTLIWFTNSIVPTVLGCLLLPFQKLKTVKE
ncbi:MAG: lysylphosphatidylglycerol synthase domain-containing protein [Nonlabens sp.]|uniref:lysylphosphatidylglycerol synthase domain-containing protein n=1 Tax=Nonlabens sp. TaxID=1888209 RepID=UPI003297269A